LPRNFGITENPREKETTQRLWQLAGALVQKAAESKSRNACSHLNQSLMELGALICTPRSPQCTLCPARPKCTAFKQGLVEQLPNLEKRVAMTSRRMAAFVVRDSDKYLVRQRPSGVVNAHLWEFPNAELVNGDHDVARAANRLLGFTPLGLRRLCTIKHSITRYRITLDAFTYESDSARSTIAPGHWRTVAELQTLSFPSAHKKILTILQRSA
jgi:A/G-specific adenine glycosylase